MKVNFFVSDKGSTLSIASVVHIIAVIVSIVSITGRVGVCMIIHRECLIVLLLSVATALLLSVATAMGDIIRVTIVARFGVLIVVAAAIGDIIRVRVVARFDVLIFVAAIIGGITRIARFDVRALMTMTTRRLANIGLLSSNRHAIVRRKVEVGLLVVELIGHRRSRVRVGDVVTTVVITAVAGPLVVRGDDIAVVLVLRLPDSTVVASELELVVLRLLDLNWLFGVVAHAVSTDVEELSNRHRDDGESRVDLRLSPASVIVATENGHLLLIFQSIGELRFANEYRRQENLVVGIDWLVVLRGKVVRPELRRKGDNRVSLSSFGGLHFLRDEIVAFTEFVDDLVRISFRCVGIGKVGQLSFIQSSVGATELGISAEELARILPGIGGGSNRKDCC